MGGKKSSSSNATNVTDNRIGATDSAVVVAGNGRLTITDPGIVKAIGDSNARVQATATTALTAMRGTTADALDFAGDSLEQVIDFAQNAQSGAFELVNTANKSLRDTSDNAIAAVSAAQRADSTEVIKQLIQMAGLSAAGLIVAKVLK